MTRLGRSTSFVAGCGALLLAGATLLIGGDAGATISVTQVNVVEGDGGTSGMTRPTNAQYWISYDDCVNNTVLQFTVATSDSSISVGASASVDCSDLTAVTVTPTNAYGECYPIASNVANDAIVSVGAHDLVKGVLDIDCQAGQPITIPSGESFTWPVQISFYFYVPVAGTTSSDSYTWPPASTSTGTTTTTTTAAALTEDIALVGPQPPSPVGLGIGDGVLFASLPSTPTDSNTVGYYIFCYPQDTDGGTASTDAGSDAGMDAGSDAGMDAGSDAGMDAGSTGTGGASAGTGGASAGTGGADAGAGGAGGNGTGTQDCPAGTQPLDKTPSYNSSYICGSQVAATTTSYPITSINGSPVVNGTPYIVAIAAYDEVWNLGPFAPLQCGTPQIVDSFFNTYCAEGGPGCVGGCGSCTVGAHTDPVWPVLGVTALAAVGIMVRRDRRRRAPRAARSLEQE